MSENDFDEKIEKNTGLKFVDVQTKIQRLELLITFLVS